jgi:hypothetical protein
MHLTVQFHTLAALHSGKKQPPYLNTGKPGRLQISGGRHEQEKELFPLMGIEPQFLVAKFLYRKHHLDCIIVYCIWKNPLKLINR